MNSRIRLVIGCLAAVTLSGAAPDAGRQSDKLDTLPAAQAIPTLTQRLMDAVPSDATVWRRYLSDRAVYVSEAGDVSNKADLLTAFSPFPPGLSGSIEVRNQTITELGDVAISVYDAHEKQTVFDQHLSVDYRVTHTWRREHGRWRLILAHNMVLAKDPAPLPIDTRRLRDYPGTYELSGKRRFRVELHADTLLSGPEGRALTRLIPVGDNVFVEAGSSLGILRIFVRGPDGAVARMVQRRKFADLDWLRVPESKPAR